MKLDEIRSFEEFKAFLSDVLGVAEDTLTPETHFMYDLGIESLKLVELLLQFELRLGCKVPLDSAWDLETVGQAYAYYRQQADGAASAARAAAE